MTALPSNLALVGDDLARATFMDARRALRRRRLATCAVAPALFALMASAAVANGWLFGGATPVLRVVPSLSAAVPPGSFAPSSVITAASAMAQAEGARRDPNSDPRLPAPLGSATGDDARTLLTGLGSENRSLSVVPTTSGGTCVALSGVAVQCIATFAADQKISWFSSSPTTGPAVVWGLMRADVTGVDAVSADGTTHKAEVGNGAFYVEIGKGPPERVIVHLDDGTSQSFSPAPCPLLTPACTTP
jgi:hypothetical protein